MTNGSTKVVLLYTQIYHQPFPVSSFYVKRRSLAHWKMLLLSTLSIKYNNTFHTASQWKDITRSTNCFTCRTHLEITHIPCTYIVDNDLVPINFTFPQSMIMLLNSFKYNYYLSL